VSKLDAMHAQAQRVVRDGVSGSVAALIDQVTLERSPEVRDAYATAVARLINGGHVQSARMAAQYIGTLAPPVRSVDLATILADRAVEPNSGMALGGLLRLWSLLDDDVDEAEARALAGTFGGDLAATNLQGTMRATLDEATDAAEREPRWRLEPSPAACEWCRFIADTGARYLSAETVPIPHSPGGAHPGGVCGCTPAPDFEGE
jgi:hypothetical protein